MAEQAFSNKHNRAAYRAVAKAVDEFRKAAKDYEAQGFLCMADQAYFSAVKLTEITQGGESLLLAELLKAHARLLLRADRKADATASEERASGILSRHAQKN
ncbi:MAG: hypothetical protein HY291_02200 [Planctomycetes bacterium]|nr:hypothetical protein [Planctomycetota bacterium]